MASPHFSGREALHIVERPTAYIPLCDSTRHRYGGAINIIIQVLTIINCILHKFRYGILDCKCREAHI